MLLNAHFNPLLLFLELLLLRLCFMLHEPSLLYSPHLLLLLLSSWQLLQQLYMRLSDVSTEVLLLLLLGVFSPLQQQQHLLCQGEDLQQCAAGAAAAMAAMCERKGICFVLLYFTPTSLSTDLAAAVCCCCCCQSFFCDAAPASPVERSSGFLRAF